MKETTSKKCKIYDSISTPLLGYKSQHSPGTISKLFFGWMSKSIWRAYKEEFRETDIFPIRPEFEAEGLGNILENAWVEEKESVLRKCKPKPSLVARIVRTYGLKYLRFSGLALLDECVIKIAQAFCLGGLVESISNGEDPSNYYLWTLGMFLLLFPSSLCKQHYYINCRFTGVQVATALSTITYRKALRISQQSLSKTSPGQIINYLSNDINGFIYGSAYFPFLWIAPIHLIISVIFLWFYIGAPCLTGIAVLFFYILFQAVMGKLFAVVRKNLAQKTDKRIKLTNEVFKAIGVIKMYVWETAFANVLKKYRKEEMDQESRTHNLHSINSSLSFVSSKLMLLLTFYVIVLTGSSLTARNVFVTMLIYNYVKLNLTNIFVLSISHLSQQRISCKRIQEFLLLDELDSNKIEQTSLIKDDDTVELSLINVAAKWTKTDEKSYTIHNINASIGSGELLAIIGPVGSGKSSILQAILTELPLLNGRINVKGSVAYASQEAWIFNSSIRENILFGQPYKSTWYERVIDACCLQRDLKSLKYGDKTLAGEQGSALSGGQKARVNLARAVYRNADIYLLDDPLSAIDAEVGKHIFEQCIGKLLKPKTVVLVTHQIQFLKDINVTNILVLNNGRAEATGTFEELLNSRSPVIKNLFQTFQQDSDPHSDPLSVSGGSDKLGSVGYNGSNSSQESSNGSKTYVSELEKEHAGTGGVSYKIYWSYISAGINWFTLSLMIFVIILTQALGTGTDYWLTVWANTEEEIARNRESPTKLELTSTIAGFFQNLTTDPIIERNIFAILVGVLFIFAFSRGILYYRLCFTSSVNLYQKLFSCLIHAQMSFFDNVQSGIILNRFSKDIGIVDDVLPPTLYDVIDLVCLTTGALVLILIGSLWLLIPSVILLILLYLSMRIYLKAGIGARRYETIAKSSVYSHLSSTLLGLPTIRSAKQETNNKIKFYALQNHHSSTWYFCLGAVHWLQIRAEWLTLLYVGIVSITLVSFSKDMSPAFLGLCICVAQTLGMQYQWGIRQFIEVDNLMVSVERILEYTKIQSEPRADTSPHLKPHKSWPTSGRIRMNNLTLCYSSNNPPILKNITLEIKAKEKVGIVGRTGAGKSSLISMMFRLYEPTSGSLYIDGVDVLSLGLRDLRSKISIIPQDPTLFSGTIRSNLDPFGNYSDSEIIQSLKDVQLIQEINTNKAYQVSGLSLESEVYESGNNLSVGQRQLICLGRAMLCRNKILILDEATANVDKETDALIQTTIRRNFNNCTVLTIAHRLKTVLDYDRILVMDNGMIMDFDKPSILLQNPSSSLYRLAELTGDKSLFQSQI